MYGFHTHSEVAGVVRLFGKVGENLVEGEEITLTLDRFHRFTQRERDLADLLFEGVVI